MADYFEEISAALIRGKSKDLTASVQKALDNGVSADEILNKGLLPGMDIVSDKFQKREFFVPEVLMAARAMNAGTALIKPLLSAGASRRSGKVVIGTVKGDLHDIGKNLVIMMMEGKGLEVVNLGNDVPPEKFIEAAKAEHCDILAMSAMLTTTMNVMKDVVNLAVEAGIRDNIKIMIGGAPCSKEFAELIGADCYTLDGNAAAVKAYEYCS